MEIADCESFESAEMEILTHVCGQCGKEQPLTKEFFCGHRFGGLSNRCRACARKNVEKANLAKDKEASAYSTMTKAQDKATKAMIQSLGDLSHVPERLRPQYEHYKNMLVLGEHHAMEFRLTTRAA